MLDDKVILITGGTGSFGYKFTELTFKKFKPKKIIIFSRDEYKQFEMAKVFPEKKYPIRFFIGDVRDKERLYRAFDGVDIVIHAAALKQVPTAEYNPFEAVKTNILGAENVINAAIDRGVKKVITLSTDKAVSPVNLYGATKLVMERLFVAGNAYAGSKETSFCVVRYGNVVGSRGSVVPFFLKLAKEGKKEFPITDERMTRFWITLEEGVKLVWKVIETAKGGEVFVPRIPSMKIVDLARAISPECKFKIIGIRPGEKVHETLICEEEGRKTKKLDDNTFVILPQFQWRANLLKQYEKLPSVPEKFIYRSDKNDWWLSVDELKEMLKGVKVD
ncbi:UDP-N-acetylglucosamine 4,6-dehydratase [Thermodesulfatator indicus DSM 15286]|uniref:UDP-N-acetylglucosamine 4,6-dehydratase n=1 Tax=Thermodesulfatator indicus (strain DSM 15286 / JCM 11887 / CIR29812) TaxID=667014 RepID=F8AAQ3_THEID|nr:UDP-N-acetylglucosamine 4,6-dehydratase (inverting) [Thermodesulfatator indicus]AEH44327.1 UDP-N-acetylglucosamine 4,6-dehydratase [Thermodesulfatator indicus DSM 15286]